jgi:hypothetical protein
LRRQTIASPRTPEWLSDEAPPTPIYRTFR